MKVELAKPGEEIDASKSGRVSKVSDVTEADEVSAHSAIVNFICPNCGAALRGIMDIDPQTFICPNCGASIVVTV
jgi:predicted RNA-binding Zn-ribbon protein involved in translation (DUF1610 family)